VGLDPWAVVEPGFQLSFVAVAAIYALAPRLSAWLDGRPCPAVLRTPIAVSVACTVATAPISWWHFDRASLAGSVPANLLALPLVAPALWLAVVAVLAYPIAPPVTIALDVAIDGLAGTLIRVAELGAWLDGRGAIVLALVGLPLTLALRTRHPLARLAPGLAVLALAVVCAPLLVAHPIRAPPAALRVTFLDVGQGNATLIEAPGFTVLDDAGPPAADVARRLKELGVRRLDLLVLSHPQSDHVGGAADVLAGVTVGRVLDPGLQSSEPFELAALAAAGSRGVPVTVARSGMRVRAGPVELRVLGPQHVVPGEDPNRAAIVLEVSQGACRFLLPADAESDVTAPLRLPQATVLEVAHHGSADAGLEDLLRRVRPAEAVISVGKDNSYGHPAPATLETLARAGVRIRRTDREGDVSLACPDVTPG
jgi:competence protein ComEC